VARSRAQRGNDSTVEKASVKGFVLQLFDCTPLSRPELYTPCDTFDIVVVSMLTRELKSHKLLVDSVRAQGGSTECVALRLLVRNRSHQEVMLAIA
jgi:hypothetical protein